MTLVYILPLYLLAWACAHLCLKDPVLLEKSASTGKYWQLDGLRFFLAFSVFLHHSFIIRDYVATGRWALTGDRVVTFLGQGGVSLFFIITAFLFWDKALKRPLSFDAVIFFIGRIRRLAPAYLVVAIPFLFLSLAHLPSPGWGLFGDIFKALSLGYFGSVNVGGLGLSAAYAGAFWTLFYEWKFYFFLPVLYILLRLKNGWNITVTISFIILMLSVFSDTGISKDWPYISLFAAGILAATLYNSKYFNEIKVSQTVINLIIPISIVLNILSNTTYYGSSHPILFLVTFLALLKVDRTSVAGRILSSHPTTLLGHASYSMYVAHGFVISALSILISSFAKPFSDTVFILFCLLATIVVSFLSIAVYKYIELPYAFRKITPQGVTPQ